MTAHIVSLTIHRLRFSPYAKSPGPQLAAATLWCEFYYDYIEGGGGGLFFKQIDHLHAVYGRSYDEEPARASRDAFGTILALLSQVLLYA